MTSSTDQQQQPSTNQEEDPISSAIDNPIQLLESQLDQHQQQQHQQKEQEPSTTTTNSLSDQAIASIITQVSPNSNPINLTSNDSSKSLTIQDPPSHHTLLQEDPSIPSREGTHHTITSNADQTLVDTNDSTLKLSSELQQQQQQQQQQHPQNLEPTKLSNPTGSICQPHSLPIDATTTTTTINPNLIITDAKSNPINNTTITATKETHPPSKEDKNPSYADKRTNKNSNHHINNPSTPSTSTTTSSQQTNPKTVLHHPDQKVPTRKKLIRFLLPCFHSKHHHDSQSDHSGLKPKSPTNLKHRSQQEMSESNTRQPPLAAAAVSSASSSSSTSRPTRRSPLGIAKQLRKQSKYSTSSSSPARRPPSSQLLPTPVPDTITPAGAAAATSAANAHGSAGVQVPIDETEGVLSGSVVPPGKDVMAIRKSVSALRLASRTHSDLLTNAQQNNEKTGTDDASLTPGDGYQDLEDSEDEEDDEEDRIVAMGGMGIPIGSDGLPRPLLAPLDENHRGRKCLVLDLDETLVHSSFKMIPQSDFVVPVEIENSVHNVHVIKRPGVDEFMRKMGEIYEVVVFTASLSKYADPVLDILDIHRVVRHRLFRESCYNHKGNYVKDLSQLGRPINQTIIIDNSPASYIFHPNNAVPVSSWFNDPHDTELTDLAAFLTDIAHVPDVRGILDPSL